MKKLAVLKPLVDVYAREEAALKGTDGTRQQVLDRLRACDERLSGIKAEEETQRAHVSELRTSEAAKSQDVPTLVKERDECRHGSKTQHVKAHLLYCWRKTLPSMS